MSELQHYSSPYYDPQKAHEYYIRNRKLKNKRKGRLTEEGKQAIDYVRMMLNKEQKSNIEKAKKSTESDIKAHALSSRAKISQEKKAINADIKAHSDKMENEISKIRAKLKELKGNVRGALQGQLLSQIEKLREENNSFRQSIRNNFSSFRKSEMENHTKYASDLRKQAKNNNLNTKKDYKERLKLEIDKIYNSGEFSKAPIRSGRSSKKRGSTKHEK